MGMYTEIYVNVDLKENTPEEVINTLRAICEFDYDSEYLVNKPTRWSFLFGNGSYYTPCTSVCHLTFDAISNQWSLLGKGDIKNYEGEIEQFFEYIEPWVEDKFMGYMRYEEHDEPKLMYKNEIATQEHIISMLKKELL
jgi:hypothetical protein